MAVALLCDMASTAGQRVELLSPCFGDSLQSQEGTSFGDQPAQARGIRDHHYNDSVNGWDVQITDASARRERNGGRRWDASSSGP